MAVKNYFGLDIGSSTIKLVHLSKEGQNAKLLAYGLAPTPGNGMSSEADFDKEAIVEIIKRLVRETKVNTNQVVLGLPESKVFTRVVQMPILSDRELASAIKFESEQYIPRPLAELSLRWQILDRGDKAKNTKMEILLVAAPLNLIQKYTDIVTKADLKPIAIETDLLSQARSLVGNNPYSPTTMVVSIGRSSTDLSILRGGQITFTRSVSAGGDVFTRAIASDLSIELEQAENYKRTYGVLEDQMEGKIVAALRAPLELIRNEIQRAISYYQSKKPDDQVKRIVISSGNAKIPGLLIYFASAFGTEVQIGDPWFNIKVDERISSQLAEDAPLYSVAVGLALKEV